MRNISDWNSPTLRRMLAKGNPSRGSVQVSRRESDGVRWVTDSAVLFPIPATFMPEFPIDGNYDVKVGKVEPRDEMEGPNIDNFITSTERGREVEFVNTKELLVIDYKAKKTLMKLERKTGKGDNCYVGSQYWPLVASADTITALASPSALHPEWSPLRLSFANGEVAYLMPVRR